MDATDDPEDRKIGEIAALTGMTVRTLHYYEEIGLLEPESRTDAGHRLYGNAAVERLYKISLLRQLGLSLTAIQTSLDADHSADAASAKGDLRTLMTEHLHTVEARVAAENRLRTRLLKLVGTLDSTEDTTGDLLNILEDMTMMEPTVNRRISILVYEDLEAAHEYLLRVFGFGPGDVTRDPDGTVVHAEIQAGDGEFWLHQEASDFGLRSPNNLGGASSTMAVMVEDVDAHYRYAVEQGATIRYEPIDQPYGYREYGALDLDGHLWSFMKPLS